MPNVPQENKMIFRKKYKFKEGDIVKQKITGWRVVLLNNNWRIDQGKIGEWDGKIWVETNDGTGYWKRGNFFESELELLTKKVHRGVVECPHCQKTFTIR